MHQYGRRCLLSDETTTTRVGQRMTRLFLIAAVVLFSLQPFPGHHTECTF